MLEAGVNGAAASIEVLSEALREEPASPYRWCDLGEAFMESGEMAQARRCFHTAADLGSRLPRILLRVANFHFRSGDKDPALEYSSRILALTDQYDQLLFSTWSATGAEPDEFLRRCLAANNRAARAYLRYRVARDQLEGLPAVWNWMRSQTFVDDGLAAEYVNYLLRRQEIQQALDAWVDYLGMRAGSYPTSNRLFNGGFESTLTDCRFDWLIEPSPAFDVGSSEGISHTAARALRLIFHGTENLDFHHVSQLAVVEPGLYKFQAWIRPESLTTDEGVGFRVFDAEQPSRLDVRTETVSGTDDWKAVGASVDVKFPTRLIGVQLVRKASRRFENKIQGTCWIDTVSLKGAS